MDEFLVHFCCRHPRGWCGLKSYVLQNVVVISVTSPPARVVWIEIFYRPNHLPVLLSVATREGGVD